MSKNGDCLTGFHVPLEETTNIIELPDLDEEDDAAGDSDSGMDFQAPEAAAYADKPLQSFASLVRAASEVQRLFVRGVTEVPEQAGTGDTRIVSHNVLSFSL